jgi:hypothetical protein
VESVDNNEDMESINKDEVTIGPQLSQSKAKRLLRLVKKHFSRFTNKLRTDTYVNTQYWIRLKDGWRPVRRRIPFFAPDKQKIMMDSMKDLLAWDLIEKKETEWRAPLLVVPKPCGGLRTVIDYRGLNEMTILDSYPMPLISEILHKLAGAKYFTKMDMTEGFWHIKMALESQDCTGFAVKGGTYVWKRMLMGLKNTPATFERMMDETFNEEFQDFCQPYIDDRIIFSKTFKEHMEHI